MAKWREIGEVPDSDEESLFDREESQQQHAVLTPIHGNLSEEPSVEAAIAQYDDCMWDVPQSSVELNSLPTERTIQMRRIEVHIPTKPIPQEPESSPLSSPEPTDEDPFSFEFGNQTTTQPLEQDSFPTGQENGPETVIEHTSPGLQTVEEDQVAARRELARFGRSLRPRKPIQEHPYLLENAQYSTLFKSHGIRPVRLPPAAERQQAQEEDSQEQDYEDDSQLASRNGPRDVTLEDQDELLQGSLDEDRDELALSPPLRPSALPQPPNSSQLTSNASQNDEELPSLGELFRNRSKRGPKTYAKRRGSPKQSPKRKAARLQDNVQDERSSSPAGRPFRVFEIPPSPPQTSPAFTSMTPAVNALKARPKVTSLTPKLSSTKASRGPTPAPSNRPAAPVDLTHLSEPESEGEAASMSGSELDRKRDTSSSPEPNMAFQRRIKGVLPASWIRLDQQLPHGKSRKPVRRSPDRSPERTNRKGVAQRRQISPSHISTNPFLSEDESDDDDMNSRNNDTQDVLETTEFSVFEDDAGSVVEEDFIDHMLPGRKRPTTSLEGRLHPAVKRTKAQKTFNGQPGVRKRQQRITGMLDLPKSITDTNKGRPVQSATSSRQPKQNLNASKRTPPRLSILDVVESNAPNFIKIAARAASKRPGKGKSSPSGKQISLGSRQDNIDTLGVLRDWKNGNIPSRPSSTTQVRHAVSQQPLQPIPENHLSRLPISRGRVQATAPINRFSRSRKLVKQTSIDKFVDIRQTENASAPLSLPDESELRARTTVRRLLGRTKSQGASLRPAQLETIGDEQANRQAFHFRKKALDSMYRRAGKVPPSAPDAQLEQVFRGQVPNPGRPPPEADFVASTYKEAVPKSSRARPRKLVRPRHIDTTAPQYAHANDPLPGDHILNPKLSRPEHPPGELTNKLLGLGPYGTHYSQHFEIFPLDYGVFFHRNTLIGQGKITKAFGDLCLDDLTQPRSQCFLTLGDQSLLWGRWDAQVSSEFGVLFDWVSETLQPIIDVVDIDAVPALTAVQAMDFALHYVQDIISLPDTETSRLFVHRILEVISGFSTRLVSVLTGQTSNMRQIVEVLPRVLLIVRQALRFCELFTLTEILQVEELLRKIAQQTVRFLLRTELASVTSLYNKLQDSTARSHGINNDQFSVVAWTTLIRVLQESRIPRSSFWDIVSSVVLESGINLVADAQILEHVWYILFSVLPLGEFDNAGVIVSNLRQTMPLEGWTLAQKLLNRVFELYKTNQHQSPSFNDYCRALVSRCHYLVEQWGWRKCSGMAGTIFDFFASQNLSHLRNEEVYKSPRFLEELAESPSLAVQPEDRCFHIFLKLLALTVQRLRRLGLIKDVKNLIARVLPNHDRQYLKESDIHENDLASLRNHHDLLCTLFWCSPQALRPTVQTLEKLVMPGSSHKEACLINLRAWNQIARFAVSNGEDRAAYKPLADWQNNVFRKVLEQHSSVESDIQQQFLRMSKDASSGVSPELIKRVVNMNKQAATDVLHFSLRANLDVMRHAPSLATASFILNSYQLHEVFTRFCSTPPGFDWSTQNAAVEIVDHYIGRIEEFLQQNDDSQSAVAWHGDDAIMVLDRHIAVPFFAMAQHLVGSFGDTGSTHNSERSIHTERTVVVASRLAALFIQHGVTRLSSFFSPGKYGLFKAQPAKLQLHPRRYVCLFVAIFIERSIVDFKSINATPLELFLCAIAQPYQALTYEWRLAEALKKHGLPFLKDFSVPKNNPDYSVNRDSFDRVLSLLRRSLRFATSSERSSLQEEFSEALRSAMDQMKADLRTLAGQASAHLPYMQFVQTIIPLIKKQDFCPVDNFFYQISSEYSPSSQDPRLQTAQILSYGLKLEDGDTRSLSTLFYFLYSNFKLAMTNGKIEQERGILRDGLGSKHVFSFMLGRMLPAIVNTSVRAPEAWLLLKTYVGSVEDILDGFAISGESDRPYIHRAIGQDDMDDLMTLIKFVLAGVNHLSTLGIMALEAQYLYTLVQLIRLLNLFGPSLVAYLCLPANSKSSVGKGLNKEIECFTEFTRAADEYIKDILEMAEASQEALHIDPLRLFDEMQYYYVDPALGSNDHINNFSKHMEDDMRKSWCTSGSIVSVRGPPKPSVASTQSGQGTEVPAWDVKQIAREMHEQLKEWNRAFDRSPATAWNRRPVLTEEELLF